MQSEIAPPEDHDREHGDVLAGVLVQLNRALAACLDEIEALNRRVDELEERTRSG